MVLNSSNIVGIYLRLEDELSPTLAKVGKAYNRLQRIFDKASEKIEKRAKQAFDVVGKIAKSIEAIVTGSSRLTGGHGVKSKGPGSFGGGGATGAKTIKFHMEPVLPKRKKPGQWDTTNLKERYKSFPQPPNYDGMLHFAKGGIVPSKTDVIPSMLTPGEMVLPKKISEMLQSTALNSGGKAIDKGSGQFVSPAEMKKAQASLVEYGQAMQKLGFDVSRTEKFVRLLDDAIDMQTMSADKTGQAVKDYRGELEGLAEEIKNEERGMAGLISMTRKMADAFVDSVSKSNKPLALLGVASFHFADEFAQMTYSVKAQSDVMGTELSNLQQDVMTAMTEAGSSMEDAGEAMKSLGFLKLSEEEVAPFSKAILKASRTLGQFGVSTGEAADIAYNTLMKVGVSADGVESVFSGLVKATKLGNMSFHDLAGAIKDSHTMFLLIDKSGGNTVGAMTAMAGVASAMSKDWLDGAGAMKKAQEIMDVEGMANNVGLLNLYTQQTGKSWEQLVADLKSGGSKAAEAMVDMQLVASQIPDEIVNATYATDDFLKSTYGLTKAEILQTKARLTAAGGLENLRQQYLDAGEAAMASAAQNEQLDKLLSDLNTSVSAVWASLKGKLIPILIQIGGPIISAITTVMGPVLTALGAFSEWLQSAPTWAKYLVSAIVGISTAITGASAALAVLRVAMHLSGLATVKQIAGAIIYQGVVYAITAAQWLWNAALTAGSVAMAILTSPITLIIAAVLALGAAVYLVIKNWDWLVKKGGELWDWFKGFLAWLGTTMLEGFTAIGTTLATAMSSLFDGIQNLWGTVTSGLATAMDNVCEMIKWPFQQAWEFISNLFDWSKLIQFVIQGISQFVNKGIIDPINAVIDKVNGLTSYAGIAAIPKIPYLADGGIVSKPTLAVIGEAGPEAVVPVKDIAMQGVLTTGDTGITPLQSSDMQMAQTKPFSVGGTQASLESGRSASPTVDVHQEEVVKAIQETNRLLSAYLSKGSGSKPPPDYLASVGVVEHL